MSMVESGTAPGSVTRQRPCCAPARTSRHFAAYCPRPIWRRPARCVAGGRSCSLEAKIGRRLGDHADPLLVSVRSGAKFSMPGMMETVLNIGLSDESVHGLAKQAGSERFAWDSYRRLIQMFGKTVLDIEGSEFER